MKTTKLFRKYLNGKNNSNDSTITFDMNILENMVNLPEDNGIVQITNNLYIEKLDMSGLYNELLELPKFVIPFTNKRSGWDFCISDVEEHELDSIINLLDIRGEDNKINTDEESLENFAARFEEANSVEDLLNPPKKSLIDEEIIEFMRCYEISYDSLVYLSNLYELDSGQRIDSWVQRIWVDYESARLYLNNTNNNGLAEHKRKLWVLDTSITDDELSWHYKDDLFPVHIRDTMVYNQDTLKSLIKQGSGSPDTSFDMINLSELLNECLRGVPLYHVEDKISTNWEDVGAFMTHKTISDKKFDKIVSKYVKKNEKKKSNKKNLAELFNKFNKLLNKEVLMNDYVKAVGQTFVCSFKDGEGDEGLSYDLQMKETNRCEFDVAIGDRNYTMDYAIEDGVDEVYVNVKGADITSTCRDVYFAGLINIVDILVEKDDRLLGVGIVFIVEGKMLDFLDVDECVDCRVDL